MGGQHREHRQRKRDVGGDRHRPAVDVFGVPGGQVDRDVDGGGHDHPAECGCDRQRGACRVAQVAGDELALELQPDHEEEDRQQPVGGPRRNTQIQVQGLWSKRELGDRSVGRRPRRVRPYQARGGGRQQQHAADRFLAQDLGEPLRLQPRAARKQSGRHWPKSSEPAWLRPLPLRRSSTAVRNPVARGGFTVSSHLVRREVWSAVAPPVTTQTRTWESEWRCRDIRRVGSAKDRRFIACRPRRTLRRARRAHRRGVSVVTVDSNALDAARLLAEHSAARDRRHRPTGIRMPSSRRRRWCGSSCRRTSRTTRHWPA